MFSLSYNFYIFVGTCCNIERVTNNKIYFAMSVYGINIAQKKNQTEITFPRVRTSTEAICTSMKGLIILPVLRSVSKVVNFKFLQRIKLTYLHIKLFSICIFVRKKVITGGQFAFNFYSQLQLKVFLSVFLLFFKNKNKNFFAFTSFKRKNNT